MAHAPVIYSRCGATKRKSIMMANIELAKKYNPTAPFLFILGMHRSGTSCLAGSLEQCGLFLGKVSRQNRHNLKGNHELGRVARLNNRIFEKNGGSWREPPEHMSVSVWDLMMIRLTVFLLARKQPCGIKDPRITLLLESWAGQVKSFSLIGSFRHPEAVAQSLISRNRKHFDPETAYDLWLAYKAPRHFVWI